MQLENVENVKASWIDVCETANQSYITLRLGENRHGNRVQRVKMLHDDLQPMATTSFDTQVAHEVSEWWVAAKGAGKLVHLGLIREQDGFVEERGADAKPPLGDQE